MQNEFSNRTQAIACQHILCIGDVVVTALKILGGGGVKPAPFEFSYIMSLDLLSHIRFGFRNIIFCVPKSHAHTQNIWMIYTFDRFVCCLIFKMRAPHKHTRHTLNTTESEILWLFTSQSELVLKYERERYSTATRNKTSKWVKLFGRHVRSSSMSSLLKYFSVVGVVIPWIFRHSAAKTLR